MVTESIGFIHGFVNRTIALFAVAYKDKARWVYFIVDSGSPTSFLSSEVSALFVNEANSSDQSRPASLSAYDKRRGPGSQLEDAHSSFPSPRPTRALLMSTSWAAIFSLGINLEYCYVSTRIRQYCSSRMFVEGFISCNSVGRGQW